MDNSTTHLLLSGYTSGVAVFTAWACGARPRRLAQITLVCSLALVALGLAGCTRGAQDPPAQSAADEGAAAAVAVAAESLAAPQTAGALTAAAGELRVAAALLPAPSPAAAAVARERAALAPRDADAHEAAVRGAVAGAGVVRDRLAAERAAASAGVAKLRVELREASLGRVNAIFAAVGAALLALGAFAFAVSVFVGGSVPAGGSLRLAALALSGGGAAGGTLPFLWSDAVLVRGLAVLILVSALAGAGWLLWRAWKAAREENVAVADCLAQGALAREALTLVAGEVDKLKVEAPEAAKALTSRLATTLDSDHEEIIREVRVEAAL
jgi:hypothetical protein